jgi:alpha-galactosidase
VNRIWIVAVLAALAAGCSNSHQPGSQATASPPAIYNPPIPAGYILTPPAPHTPHINGPLVFGVRPGNPFLYSISATGDRPMSFVMDNLPTGLSIDSNTGQITGALPTPGNYFVTLYAKNALGVSSHPLHIVVGDEISLTPAMGWNSWNCWAGSVDQDKVLHSAKAMVSSGLSQHGWTYINIDDTWQGQRAPDTHALQPNQKFPDMKSLCDQIHAMGLKAGIYSTPWIQSYANFAGGSSDDPDGAWTRLTGRAGQHVGKYSFPDADAKQWAAWGFDYLKYDWNPNLKPEVQAMADALHASGRDIVYSLSNAAPFATADDYVNSANSWRTTGDIRDAWSSVANIGFNQAGWAPFERPGHYNDPDMLVVGYVGWGANLHLTHLTQDEQYTHISLWCLLSAPLLLGCDLDRLDPFTLNLLTNDEVLAIDQDPLGMPAYPVWSHGDARVYCKQLADGSAALGMFNLGTTPLNITAELPGFCHVRDLWRQKDIGGYGNRFSAIVPPHGVVLIKASGIGG